MSGGSRRRDNDDRSSGEGERLSPARRKQGGHASGTVPTAHSHRLDPGVSGSAGWARRRGGVAGSGPGGPVLARGRFYWASLRVARWVANRCVRVLLCVALRRCLCWSRCIRAGIGRPRPRHAVSAAEDRLRRQQAAVVTARDRRRGSPPLITTYNADSACAVAPCNCAGDDAPNARFGICRPARDPHRHPRRASADAGGG
jgi:hypothetical protein